MARGRTVRVALALVSGMVLAGCIASGPGPGARPQPPAQPVPVAVPTAKSAAAAAYYAQVQQMLLAQGMLRTDGGGDIPVSDRMIAENFLRIALFDEYLSLIHI